MSSSSSLTSNDRMAVLMSQAAGLEELVPSAPGMSSSERLKLAAQVAAEGASGKKKRSSGKSRAVPLGEDRCQARVWGSGSGCDQCKSSSIEGSDFCKTHHMKTQERVLNGSLVSPGEEGWDDAEVLGTKPCVLCDTTHKRLGLFCGSISEPVCARGECGRFIVKWNNDTTKSEMEEAKLDGTFEWHPWAPGHGEEAVAAKRGSKGTGKPRKKKVSEEKKEKSAKKSKKPRGKNSYLFFAESVRGKVVEELSSSGDSVRQPDVAKKIGAMWKAMSEEEKAPFKAMAEKAKKDLASSSDSEEVAEEIPMALAVEAPMAAVSTTEELIGAAQAAVEQESEEIFGSDDEEDEDDDGYTSEGGTAWTAISEEEDKYGMCREDDVDMDGEEFPPVAAWLYKEDGRFERV